MQGRIKSIHDRGYGFIARQCDRSTVFFHITGCKCDFNDLSAGDVVAFDEKNSDRGPVAFDVTIIEQRSKP